MISFGFAVFSATVLVVWVILSIVCGARLWWTSCRAHREGIRAVAQAVLQ